VVKVILDTNVLISAFIFGGKPRIILEQVIRGNLQLNISDPILDEIKRVLNRPKFNYPPSVIQLIIYELLRASDFVIPMRKVNVIEGDPDDNKILECAIESGADYIVTGDSHLLKLETYKKTKIVSPSKFCHDQGL